MSKIPEVSNNSLEEMTELVRQHPELYDAKHPDHKDAVKTSNIWASITTKLAEDNPRTTGRWLGIDHYNITIALPAGSL